MATATTPIDRATRLAGPCELLPGCPDAVIDLQTAEGAELLGARWRYADAVVRDIDFVHVGPDLGPSGEPSRTYDIEPHAEGADFDDTQWRELIPEQTQLR